MTTGHRCESDFVVILNCLVSNPFGILCPFDVDCMNINFNDIYHLWSFDFIFPQTGSSILLRWLPNTRLNWRFTRSLCHRLARKYISAVMLTLCVMSFHRLNWYLFIVVMIEDRLTSLFSFKTIFAVKNGRSVFKKPLAHHMCWCTPVHLDCCIWQFSSEENLSGFVLVCTISKLCSALILLQ